MGMHNNRNVLLVVSLYGLLKSMSEVQSDQAQTSF